MMKFAIPLLIAICFQSIAKGYGQGTVSLTLEKVQLKKALKAIEDRGIARFVYKDDILPRNHLVSINAKNETVDEILKKLFHNTSLTYRRLNDNLIVITTEPPAGKAITVSGKVTDHKGDPLPGVNVVAKGVSNGTITNDDGLFILNVGNRDITLMISCIGYLTQELETAGKSTVEVALQPSNLSMQDVIVVGYGQTRKSLVTGSISSVKADQLTTVSSTRLDQALQGRTAGVLVLPTSGQPGAGVHVRIRGTGSNRNSNPLYIIDGIRAGGIEYIDPSEIASVEVLKDAASAAIYGAEGANGVIMVTTKTGKRNASEITYNGQYIQQSVRKNFIEMMDAPQYQQYLLEAGVAGAPTFEDVADIGAGTDWLREVTHTAPQQHHSLQFSGGSDKSDYLVGGSLFTQEGVIGGNKSRFNRYTVRFNGDHQVRPWLTIGNRLAYSHHKRRAISDNSEYGSVMGSALLMDPVTPVNYTGTLPSYVQGALAAGKPLRRDANGNLYGVSRFLKGDFANPLARIDIAKGENVQNKIVGNVFADIQPVEPLTVTSRFGIDAAFQTGHGWVPAFWFSDEFQNTTANGYDYNNNWYTWQWENFATYKKSFGGHSFSLLGGMSAIKTHEYHIGASYSGIFREDDRFSYADYVPDRIDVVGSIAFDYTLASLFGRLSYSYRDRYLLNVSVRRDGSSKLSPGNRWKTYPALSAGWILSNEMFFQEVLSANFNYIKLRGSWGQNGNVSSIGIADWLSAIGGYLRYPDGNGNLITGAAPISLANPDLTWETGDQFDIGVDLGFLGNRLNLSIDYYKKTTCDLLTDGNAPLIAGNILWTKNAGNMVNKGLEAELSYYHKPPVQNGLAYGIDINLSTMSNKVTTMDRNSPILYGTSVGSGWLATAIQAGYPLWYFNGYQTNGIFQSQTQVNDYLNKTGITGYNPKPGEPVVVDVNGDKQITPSDMTYIGSPHPDLLFGGRLSVAYKGFDLMVFIQGQTGNEILMGFNRTDQSTTNKPLFFYTNRWTGEGSTNTWFASSTSNPYIYNGDLMIFDGSYTRIRQLQLGYTLPQRLMDRMKISLARVYISLDDFFTFTRYPGVDPEGGSNWQNSIGIDRGGYPIPRKAIIGLTLNF